MDKQPLDDSKNSGDTESTEVSADPVTEPDPMTEADTASGGPAD
jgi:hypothetical protein